MESRRRFLKELGSAAAGAACLPLAGTSRLLGEMLPAANTQWALVVDLELCQRDDVRAACVAACHREHNVPAMPDHEERVEWIWTEEYEHVFSDLVHEHTPEAVRASPVLVLCNHCTNPPCVKVCPTGATWKRASDGIVMMDMHRCIGCRYCMAACPYGSRSFNWRDPRPYVERDAEGKAVSNYPTRTMGVVEKCNFCAERLRAGREPACVEAARTVPGAEGALTFGDVTDPDSAVSRVLRDEHTVTRLVSLGTGPNVYYIVARSPAPAVTEPEGA
jgi:molybdopterin-containing oxidoreductase family iron-sulfur binding subunit